MVLINVYQRESHRQESNRVEKRNNSNNHNIHILL